MTKKNTVLTDEQQAYFDDLLGPDVPDVRTAIDGHIDIVANQLPVLASARNLARNALEYVESLALACENVQEKEGALKFAARARREMAMDHATLDVHESVGQRPMSREAKSVREELAEAKRHLAAVLNDPIAISLRPECQQAADFLKRSKA